MDYSTAGLALTKHYEGLSLTAYQDAGGVWTIGYGHTGMVYGEPIREGMTITEATADGLLQGDLRTAVLCVDRAVKVPKTQGQFDAMVDFCYNLGCAAFLSSTLLRLVNLGEPHLAASQFPLWVHCDGKVLPGLVARREAEAEMFNGPIHITPELASTVNKDAAKPANDLQESDMSFFSAIKAAEHSTMAWIEKTLTEIENKAPAIEKVVDAGLTYITPVLQIALTATGDPAAAAVVGAVSKQAQTDLAVASAVVHDFGPTPTAATLFESVKTNLSGLLKAGHVTSPTSVAAVTKAVNEVGVLGTAISNAAAGISNAAAPSSTGVTTS